MLIQMYECPICQKNAMAFGHCTNCWWIEPDVLRDQADSYERFKEFIIAEREGRVVEKIEDGFKVKMIVPSKQSQSSVNTESFGENRKSKFDLINEEDDLYNSSMPTIKPGEGVNIKTKKDPEALREAYKNLSLPRSVIK